MLGTERKLIIYVLDLGSSFIEGVDDLDWTALSRDALFY